MTAPRFVADAMLGKLVTYLRMCGNDTVYAPDENALGDDELVRLACDERRVVLTRDTDLAARTDGVLVESHDVRDQLRELRDADVDVSLELTEPTRCSVCNGVLSDDEADAEDVPDDVRSAWRCDDCGKTYWKGSHWDDVQATLDAL